MTNSNDTLNACPDCAAKEREILRLRQEVAVLKQAVVTDSLTGLFNKQPFDDTLKRELERTRRTGLPTSLVLLDVDYFKAINDTYGHLAGDDVLRQLGDTLRRAMRTIDIPCRYGGEEFALILPSTPVSVAAQVAGRLRAAIAQQSLKTAPQVTINITASFGVSAYHKADSFDYHELINRADRQLYKAKKLGRNRVCTDSSVNQKKDTRLTREEKGALYRHDTDDNSQDPE